MNKDDQILSWSLHSPEMKSPEYFDFEKHIHIFLDFEKSHLLEPTYIGLNGRGYTNNKIIKFSTGLKQLNDNSFKNLTSVSIFTSDPVSDDIAFYWETKFHLSCSNILGAHCYMGVNIKHTELKNDMFRTLVNPICQVFQPLLGYAYVTSPEDGPSAYSQGAVHTPHNEYLTEAQKELSFTWSRNQDLVASGKLRDLYQFNILSQIHLEHNVEGNTLKNWIISNPVEQGVLTPLSAKNTLWTVDLFNYHTIRDKLFESNLLIAYDKSITPTIFL